MSVSTTAPLFTSSQRATRLKELKTAFNEKIEEPKARSFFSFFHSLFRKDPQEVERQKKLGASVRDMASYLALSPGAGPTVEKIAEIGRTLAKNGSLSSEEDRALLERTRLAALLRKEPGRLQKSKENLTIYFKTKENQNLFARWKKAGFPEDAFLFNPTISPLIFKTHLHHKMKAFGQPLKGFGDSFQYDEPSHEFRIRVDGVFRNVAEIAERLSVKESLDGFVTSLVTKGKDNERWDYLPQKGLTKWDESGWKKLRPIAQLNSEQVKYAQDAARRSDGTNVQPGDYVVEIVVSKEDLRQIPLVSGVQESFKRFRHPWIRIITPDGKLYCAGFGMGQDFKTFQLAAAINGTFRSPDSHETRPFSQRYISGFAVSRRTGEALIKKVEKYQGNGPRFNIIEKNCTAFIQRAREIIDPKKKESFSAEVPELFRRCLPVTLQKIGEKLSPVWRFITYYSKQFSPPIVIKIARVAASLFRLIAERIAITFFGRWFSYGKKDSFPTAENPHKGIPWYKFITHINIALKRKLVKAFLPVKLGEWMEKLPQNRIVKDDLPLLEQYRKPVSETT